VKTIPDHVRRAAAVLADSSTDEDLNDLIDALLDICIERTRVIGAAARQRP